MRGRITGLITAAAIIAGNLLPFASLGAAAEGNVWLPNPINVHENLDRGLVAMVTDEGVYLSWRLQADEDNVYGTARNNVSFDIYRDGTKIAVESYTTNYIDKDGTAASKYQVVRSGANKDTCPSVQPFSSGTNYFEIPLDVPAPVTFPSDTAASDDTEDAEEDNTATGEEDDTSAADESGKHPYTVGDSSTGDLDGDGELEIVVKWECSPKDNSHNGYTGNVILSAYKLNGTHMWDIDLGPNIRAGAHYVQHLVYDFDGDGKAEITAKTAPGSKGGDGQFVTKAAKTDEDIKAVTDDENNISYVSTAGRILTGDEYFTIFSGETGAALDTIYYPNQRLAPSIWGDADTYGNRVDRFNATVAYLDGEKPYAVYMRGYYYGRGGAQRQAACAVSYDGDKLDCHLSFDTYDVNNYKDPSGYTTSSFRKKPYSARNYKGVIGYEEKYREYVGQGNHNVNVADVDNDGRDEVLTGAMCYHIDENGNLRPLWSTFKGHGDAMHIGDYDPTHDGYEYFVVHEEGGGGYDHGTLLDYGMSLIDPGVETYGETGKAPDNIIAFHTPNSGDTGRGVMANVGAGGYYQFWGAGTRMSAGGMEPESFKRALVPNASSNFRIFWDGDLYDELLDGTGIKAWNANKLEMDVIFQADGCTSINGTKSVPALSADLFGDWREEVVFPTTDNTKLRVYTTDIYTEHKMKSLMYDNVYRLGVSAEQSGYNQPPHIGYYLDPGDNGEGMVDVAPTVSIPSAATKILHQNAENATVGRYNETLPEDVEGLSVNIPKTDSSKYIAVVNQGLTNNVFKAVNGNYSHVNRAVNIHFTDAVKEAAQAAVEAGKYSELTFVVKLFNGTDGTTGGLYFLKDTTGNSKNTDYANKIATITTRDLPEGEWGVVRYEFTGSEYNLYLNDEKISTGTTDTAVPVLAMPFTSLTGYSPYTSMIFDDIYVYSIAPEAAPTEAPAAEPEPTAKPLGAAPAKTDTVLTENFEKDTHIFSATGTVMADPATDGKNNTNVIKLLSQSAVSTKINGANKTKTYLSMDFRIDAGYSNKAAAICLRAGSNDIFNISSLPNSNGYWNDNDRITINGEAVREKLEAPSATYGGWRDTTGWITLSAAFDFDKQKVEMSLVRKATGEVLYSETLDFLKSASALEYIYATNPTAGGGVWFDNINISTDPEATLTDLTVTQPDKTEYFTDEDFNTDGMTVTANYSDNTHYELTPYEYTVSETDMTTAGGKTVTISYLGKNGTVNITVKNKSITSLSVTSPPDKTRYLAGDAIDATGLVLRADYDDESYDILTDGFTLSGFDSSTLGDKTVTASYGGKNAEFTVSVVNADELNPTPTPKPTARPKATPRPQEGDDETEPTQPVRTKKYTMALTDTSRDARVTETVDNPTNTADASVPDFGSGTEVTAAVPTLDGWGYKHYAYDGTFRQTSAEYVASTNTFNVCGIGNGGGAAISFIPANVDSLTLNDNAVQVYEFDAVVTTTGQNQLNSLPIGFTSSADGATLSSVASISLASSGQNGVEKTYKMVMVNDKINGKYYIYKDGIRMATGDSTAITGVYAQTINKYIKIGFRNLVMYEQDKTPIAVKVVFNGVDGTALTEYASVLTGTTLTAPETPIVAGKTFKEWRDKAGNKTETFTAGTIKTVYNAYYEDGSTISTINAYVDRFAKIILELGDEKTEKYSDIYGMASFENIAQGMYNYTILKEGYVSESGTLELGLNEEDLETELGYDSDHIGSLYYEADWANGAGYITDGSASGFTTDLGATNVKLPTTNGIADVFDVTVRAKAQNLANSGAAATWLLNSDKGVLLGLHWAKDDGIYAITGWSGSAVPKASTDTLEKAENKVKIADSEDLTDEITVSFAVDAAGETIVVSEGGEVKGSLPMPTGALSLNTMSAGVTNSADDIYVYSLAVTRSEDNFMALAGDTAVAKVYGKSITRSYERSEAKAVEGETFTWSLTAPTGAAEGSVTLDQSGTLTIKDTATVGTYTINCTSNTNPDKKATLDVSVLDFQKLTLIADGKTECDLRSSDEIKYTLTSAVDKSGTEVIDLIPSPIWTSSDSSVAVIDAYTGVLTMKSPGKTTVTATVNNGGTVSSVSVDVGIYNYYIIEDAAGSSAVVDISSLPTENVTAYLITTATADGTLIKQLTTSDVTDNKITVDASSADKIEIAPIYSVSDGISKNTDERYTFNLPVGTYNISVTASGQRCDVYASGQMLVNNILQHGTAETTETRNDIKISEPGLTITTSDYSSDKITASWTAIKNITVVKSPQIASRKPKMYVLGDSLVAKYYNNGSAENPLARSGWGQVIDNYITDDIEVVPLGNSGVTAQGLYKTAFTQIRESGTEGDYLLLESGYNDKTYCTKAEMQEAIYGMYNEATAKGVRVILISPNASYHDYRGNVAWTGYMEEFAENLGAEYIDLAQRSYDFLSETYGSNFSEYYEIYNVDDTLHSTYNGAEKWASLVAQGLYDLGLRSIVDTDYKYEYTDGKDTQTARVIKAALPVPEVTAPVAKENLVFNDEVQMLLETEAQTTGGTLEYSLDGESWSADTVDVSAANAGTYTVYYRVNGGATYADVAAKSIKVSIAKADRAKPEGVNSVSVTAEGSTDGRITGVNDTMEYRAKGGEYAAIAGNAIENLPAGDYEIRYAATDNYNASEYATVQVKYPITGTITWHYNYSYTTASGGEQTGEVPLSNDQRSKTARVDLLNRGEVYKTVTVTASAQSGDTATALYTIADVPVSVDGTESSYTVRITPLVAENASDTEQTVEAQNYYATFTDAANRSADINYNPYCFDAHWTVNITSIDTVDTVIPDTVYVKVLYGTTSAGAEGGTYDGYGVITQQTSGNGTACALTKKSDGTYTLAGSYPVWKYQPDGGSYFHKVIVVGYSVNGTYVDCTGKNYISAVYMQYNTEADAADKDMVAQIDKLDIPLVVFDANGGTIENGHIINSSYGAPVAEELIAAKVAERDGYTFDGWFSAKSGGSKVTSIPSLSAKTTVYAHWIRDISGAEITVAPLTYTGGNLTPEITVTLDGTTLTSADYDILITEKGGETEVTPHNAGEYTVTVTGKGSYSGTAANNFTVTRRAATVIASNQTVKLRDAITVSADKAALSSAAEGHTLSSVALDSTRTASVTDSGVITPADAVIVDDKGNDVTANYDITYISGTLTVTKGTPEITVLPAAASVPRGSTLSESALTGGTVMYGGAQVPGTFTWKNGEQLVTAEDNGSEFDIVFTPSDTVNLETVEDKVKLTVTKAVQAPPAGVTAVAAESENGKGTITGVDLAMEYRIKGGEYAAVTGSTIENLAPGTYEVRYAGTDEYMASEPVTVSVNFALGGTVTWHYAYSYSLPNGTEQSGVVPDTNTQRSRTAKVELLNRGTVYRTVTVNAVDGANNTANGTYSFTDLPVSIDGVEASYSIRITPLVAETESSLSQTEEAESYTSVFADTANRNSDIYYNPECFDATWTVNIASIDTADSIVPDTVYVKVLYGTTAEGTDGGEYDGYAIITQQTSGNGTACTLTDNGDGTYTATGKYPVWKYQPSGDSYFHKAIVTGYTVNGTFISCLDNDYIFDDYMVRVEETNKADKDMVINIDSLPLPLVVFDANGGTIDSGYILNGAYGDSISAEQIAAKVPERGSFTFDGWYDEPRGGSKVTEIAEVNEKTTLYAHWITDISDAQISVAPVTYSGAPITPQVTVAMGADIVSPDDYDITITEKGGSAEMTPVNAGEYTLTVEGKNGCSGTASKDFTVSKRDVTVSAKPQTVKLGRQIVTGAEQAVITNGGENHVISEVTLTASATDAVTTDGEITPSAASISDAEGNDVTVNYNITYEKGILIVEKGQPTVTAPTASAITVGESLAESAFIGGTAEYDGKSVSGSFAWKNSETEPQLADSDLTEYTVVFTPDNTESYENAEVKVTVTVNDIEHHYIDTLIDGITVEKLTGEDGSVTLAVTSDGELDSIKLLTAVYDDNNGLVKLTQTICTAGNDGKILVPLTEPTEDGTYKLMLWSGEMSPLIRAITADTHLFE